MKFTKTAILSNRIIKKDQTGDDEASITAEEICASADGTKTKAIFKIKYRKNAEAWEIISSEKISFEKITEEYDNNAQQLYRADQ